ncbi:urease accessory protein UreD [Phytohabitans aurantiacus]|uniref:Urease accessory protein UreD n=1 Tax=Phytohabitans aurantiacus TaxID=3016789 RepID=A0ABQ5R617_9ACTN|nr:urease accessory protein UreD [Phytohabitans aurantiacus]GLI01991.1 urease accessory protein UreD [Phytohabitans aurantiacus]
MRATARIVAVAGRGGTRLVTMRSEPPLVLRRTGPETAHLVGGAAGPLGGDRLRVEVEVGPGARLCLRAVAASLALPGASGGASLLEVAATVAAGGHLRWLPEPLIAARGCDHVGQSTVELAEGAALVWREELVCGRHGEQPGDARLETTVRYAGGTIMRQEVAVGPRAAGWDGPAVLGGGRATGSLLVVDPAWADKPPEPAVLGPSAAWMPLVGPAALATATGADLREVRAALDECLPDDV